MGNTTTSESIPKTQIYPVNPNVDTLSSISIFIMKSSLYIMLKSPSDAKLQNSIMPLSEYVQYIKDYKPKSKKCIEHINASAHSYCNNCTEWLCTSCIKSHDESHLISNIPIESNISIKQYESKQKVELIRQTIVKKIEKLNKVNDIANFYFDDYENNSPEVKSLKERYKAFYNINQSLIQITFIIISNYIHSTSHPNKTIKENFESNITLTQFENVYDILRISKSKQYQKLKEGIENLLDNPYNNMIIKPKLILYYYTASFTHILNATCFCYINKGDIVCNSFNRVFFSNLKQKSKQYLEPFHTADITSIIIINNNTFASSSLDGSIGIFSREGIIKLIKEHEAPVYQIITTKQYLISCSGDKTIKLFDINSYELKFTMNGHSADVLSLIQYDDNTIISGSTDRKIKLWSLQSHQELSTLSIYNVSSVKFLLLDQYRLMSSFAYYNQSVFELKRNELSEPFKEESDSYSQAILMQKGSLLVMGSREGSVSLFDSVSYTNIDKVRLYGEILQLHEIEDNMILVLNEKGVLTVFIVSDYPLFK